jgi:hypothetical protein
MSHQPFWAVVGRDRPARQNSTVFRNTDPREDEHAWRELLPYLPIPHADMRARLDEITGVLQRVAGEGGFGRPRK